MQTEYTGIGTIRSVEEIAATLDARRILLVTGQDSFTASGAEAALHHCLGSLDHRRFCDFAVNPRLEDAQRGIRLLHDFQPDLVVAVGGGSVLDMGKLIAILAPQPQDNYEAIVASSNISREGIPLVAIPTTSGTGSEATHFAVVYIRGKKYSLAHHYMLPDYVILDPELSYDTGPYQTAVSGMDALCQGVESYWSVHSTEQSRDYAKTAITTVLDSLEDAALAGSKTARQRMSRGANYSGKAINITKTTAPHALSYGLTSHYEIPHGHAVALILGRFFLIHEASTDSISDPRGKHHFSRITEELYEMFGCRDARSCTESWYHRMGTIGLETDFGRLGLTGPKDHDLLVKSVNPERLANHPVHLTRELLTQLFE